MSRFSEALLFTILAGATLPLAASTEFVEVGRTATPAEIKAWDIDVRADFLGLPAGSGSVSQGKEIFLAKCAACHGVAGDSAAMFAPLIGGTTAEDIQNGRVASLSGTPMHKRSLFMKAPNISSLFDYIQRAMPWTQPKSLAPDEVYAVLAYLLNLAAVVPADFTLSDGNMAEVQARLPNRNGMTTDHGLWPGAPASEGGMGNGGIADVQAERCMQDCAGDIKLGPPVPPALRKLAGNPAEQNRNLGGVRGTPLTSP
jgi:cytochrome c